MFEIRKFGAYISKLRKDKDMTQSELADKLNVTRQAVSKWEMGDSFPDVALLPELSAAFNVSIDSLINAGAPYRSDSEIIVQVANGTPEKVAGMLQKNELSADAVVNVAPVLKASALDTISEGFEKHGIDIKHVVELAAYMNEAGLANLVKKASFDKLDEEMLAKFIPFLGKESKDIIFEKIINGELGTSLLPVMRPYMPENMISLVEAAFVEGYLDRNAIKAIYGNE